MGYIERRGHRGSAQRISANAFRAGTEANAGHLMGPFIPATNEHGVARALPGRGLESRVQGHVALGGLRTSATAGMNADARSKAPSSPGQPSPMWLRCRAACHVPDALCHASGRAAPARDVSRKGPGPSQLAAGRVRSAPSRGPEAEPARHKCLWRPPRSRRLSKARVQAGPENRRARGGRGWQGGRARSSISLTR